MAQYGWDNCPDAVRIQIEGFTTAIQSLLADNLIGIYLHGSLAMNCFNPQRSDIDLLVVTDAIMSVEAKRDIAELLLCYSGQPRPIEVSFVRRADLQAAEYPPAFDFHFGEDWRGRYTEQLANGAWKTWNETVRRDVDLPSHFMITFRRGIVLVGEPISEIFGSIRPEHYAASIVNDISTAHEWIARNPVYGVLNLCRVYAYLEEGLVCSKDEGGVWGIGRLPEEHRALITWALDRYRNGSGDEQGDPAACERFAHHMEEKIEQMREHSGMVETETNTGPR